VEDRRAGPQLGLRLSQALKSVTFLKQTAEEGSMRQSRHGEIFFLVMGIVLLAVVLAGFLPPALSRPGGMASIPLMLHVHGSILLAWFVLFCTQAHFAGTGK
jgi:hypothetical protein